MAGTQSFTPTQLRELRSEMEDDFARLLRSMTYGQSDNSYSNIDAPSAEQSEPDELDALVHDRQQARLAAITAALRRFETGTYGMCARCGRRISFSRLSVMPEATLCTTCRGT